MHRCYCFLLIVALFGLSTHSASAQVRADRSAVWLSAAHTAIMHDAEPLRFPTTSNVPRILAIDTSLRSRVIANLQAVYATANPEGRHGVAGSIIAPKIGQFTFAIGENFDGDPMQDYLGFEIASNTKTFITALILKLQEEGKLSIKDSLHSWLPAFPNVDSTITIKQLLEHSSGIYDYLNDDPNNTILESAYVGDPEHVWTPEEILNEYVHAPKFKPGKSYSYSNTNFLLLGMIAAKATGMTAAEALHHYFLDPLHLANVCPAWEDTLMMPVAHSWFPGGSYPSQDLFDIPKTAQLTSAHTAGGMVARPAELARWAQIFYTGQLLSPATMKQMETWHTWSNGAVYGLGTQKVPYYSHTFIGHGGHLLGFSSDMLTNPVDSVTLVLYTNYDVLDTDKSLNDYAIAVLDAVYAPASAVSAERSAPVTVSAWPNPATSAIAFRSAVDGPVRYTLVDDVGREVGSLIAASAGVPAVLDVRNVPAGAYHYRADGATLHQTGSVIVRH